jgi:starvation-inducible DNA-binding protein
MVVDEDRVPSRGGAIMTQLLETQPTGKAAEHAAALQDTLVELIDLSLQAKQAHWNVVGPSFRPLHELLDEFTDQYRDWYDTVAERLTAIGIAPDGRSATVSAGTPLGQLPEGQLEDRAVFGYFDERVTTVASRVRDRMTILGEHDLASQDVMIEILRGLEKQRWMLRAHRV